ncbi:hypothetical protein B0H67DRAFT_663921 [Lasiosphaeris hirsuta]|uniref:Uncharacterized protein n=1 Tax=Lasiosphaeris hirsuta TaxID=260670 RepID=A0AA40DZ98_9PEZI|nr:hypothetical protein B0H67DRAFT_663921 [Lasiosphaeris hirsuta]
MLPAIRTVELMTDGETEPEIFPFLPKMLEECGMLPTTARKSPPVISFIFNLLWAAVKREALTILAKGAKVTLRKLTDQVGLETVAFIKDNYIKERDLDGELTVGWLRKNYIQKGNLGSKSDLGGLCTSDSHDNGTTSFLSNGTELELQTSNGVHGFQPAIYFLKVGPGGNAKALSNILTNGKIPRQDPATGSSRPLCPSSQHPTASTCVPRAAGATLLGNKRFQRVHVVRRHRRRSLAGKLYWT